MFLAVRERRPRTMEENRKTCFWQRRVYRLNRPSNSLRVQVTSLVEMDNSEILQSNSLTGFSLNPLFETDPRKSQNTTTKLKTQWYYLIVKSWLWAKSSLIGQTHVCRFDWEEMLLLLFPPINATKEEEEALTYWDWSCDIWLDTFKRSAPLCMWSFSQHAWSHSSSWLSFKFLCFL